MSVPEAATKTGHNVYQPLDKSELQVRFVRMLHTDSESSHLECEMSTFSLLDKPEYRALSYCWTKAQATETILLNGSSMKVRPNLYAYLRVLKEERDENWMFIDAICINQDDLAERGSQVGLMGEVYRGAALVVVWLGVGAEWNREALVIMQDVCSSEDGIGKLFIKSPDNSGPAPLIMQFQAAFLNPEYWTRVWIVQEVALAKDLVFRCNALILGLRPFMKFFAMREANELPAHFETGLDPNTQDLYDQRRRFMGADDDRKRALAMARHLVAKKCEEQDAGLSTPAAGSLVTAIRPVLEQECSVRYDKIFGVLGLTNSILKVEYQMDAVELYLRTFIETCLEQLQSPDHWAKTFTTADGCDALLRALDLSLDQPVVGLVTYRVCLYFDWLETAGYCIIIGRQRREDWGPFSYKRPMLAYCGKQSSWWYHQVRDSLGLAPSDALGKKQHNEWVRMVDDLVWGLHAQKQQRSGAHAGVSALIRNVSIEDSTNKSDRRIRRE